MTHALLIAALALAAQSSGLTGALSTGEWREFRGPGGGVYTGPELPRAWGKDVPPAWSTPIAGLGWSSPVVVGRTVVVTTAVPEPAGRPTAVSLRAVALDLGTGKVLWDRELFRDDLATSPTVHKKNSRASPTPASDGKFVVAHFGHSGTACLDLAGSVVWKSTELKYIPVHGNGASPILVDDLVIVPCDGDENPYLAALDLRTGAVRWRTERKTGARMSFSFATCLAIEHAGRRMLISPASDYTLAYDPATGKELWRVKSPAPGWSLIARPVYAAGLVFVATGYPAQQLLAIDPSGGGGAGDITPSAIRWKTKRDVPNTPTPIAVGDELYTVSDGGTLTCFDAKTGKVHYAERLGGKAYSASPVCLNGALYVTSEDGIGQVLATGASFQELARCEAGERTFATPTPAADGLLVRTESKLSLYKAALPSQPAPIR